MLMVFSEILGFCPMRPPSLATQKADGAIAAIAAAGSAAAAAIARVLSVPRIARIAGEPQQTDDPKQVT